MTVTQAVAVTHARVGTLPWTLRAGAAVTAIWVLVALLAPLISPYSPYEQTYTALLQPPSALHWFGTDNVGRDVFSRVLWGARIDLVMGLLAVLFPFIIGTTIGCIAGFLAVG